MPFINIKTNASVSSADTNDIKSELGKAITAIPGKSEGWLMVGIEDGYTLYFKGSDAPAAMVEVSVFGSASSSSTNELTGRITSIINSKTGIPSDRIYVKYSFTDDWGWNGSNF